MRERRVHKVFITQNTEYHLRRAVCVGVRDRRTGQWRHDHAALFREVSAAVRLLPNGSMTAQRSLPACGEQLLFEGEGSVLTGPVVAIERPPRDVVMGYPHSGRITLH